MRSFDQRLLFLRSLVLGACGAGQVGCGGIAVVDDGGGGAGTTASSTRTSTSAIVAASTQTSASTGGVCNGNGNGEITACLDVVGACPPASSPMLGELLAQRLGATQECPDPEFCSCDWTVTQVVCLLPSNACCYAVLADEERICEGLPFVIDGAGRVASLVAGAGWCDDDGARIEAASLSSEARARLADGYRADALAEHASVASFARLVLSLLHFGAPASLVSDVHRALADEIRHARTCLAIAESFDGRRLAPGPLDVTDAFDGRLDVETFVEAIVTEGCVVETIAALRAARSCDATTDPGLRALLGEIADDEARHAALSYRVVSFMIASFGAPARRAAERAFARALVGRERRATRTNDDALDPVALAYGRLDSRLEARATEDALDGLVRPGAARLLAAPTPTSSWCLTT